MLKFHWASDFALRSLGIIRYFAELPVFTIGFLTQARGAITGTTMDTDKEDISKDVNSFAFSWGLGAGIEYGLGTQTSIVAGIYYQNYIYRCHQR